MTICCTIPLNTKLFATGVNEFKAVKDKEERSAGQQPDQAESSSEDVLKQASQAAQEGIACFEKDDYVRATFKFIKARDAVSAFRTASVTGSQEYLHYSTCLAIVAMRQNAYEEAKEFVETGLRSRSIEVTQVTKNRSEM
jgi:negative regulator of genetic competence, sporulation and motility